MPTKPSYEEDMLKKVERLALASDSQLLCCRSRSTETIRVRAAKPPVRSRSTGRAAKPPVRSRSTGRAAKPPVRSRSTGRPAPARAPPAAAANVRKNIPSWYSTAPPVSPPITGPNEWPRKVTPKRSRAVTM